MCQTIDVDVILLVFIFSDAAVSALRFLEERNWEWQLYHKKAGSWSQFSQNSTYELGQVILNSEPQCSHL